MKLLMKEIFNIYAPYGLKNTVLLSINFEKGSDKGQNQEIPKPRLLKP